MTTFKEQYGISFQEYQDNLKKKRDIVKKKRNKYMQQWRKDNKQYLEKERLRGKKRRQTKQYKEYHQEYYLKQNPNPKHTKQRYFIICSYCGEVSEKSLSRITKKSTGLCHECYLKTWKPWNKGKKFSEPIENRNYKRHRELIEYTKWHNDCLKRDWYKCQICNSKEEIEVHHIKSYKDYPKERVNLDNGITLCKKCHLLVHNFNVLGQQ